MGDKRSGPTLELGGPKKIFMNDYGVWPPVICKIDDLGYETKAADSRVYVYIYISIFIYRERERCIYIYTDTG